MILNKAIKERIIEQHLRNFYTYRVGIKNCQKQLDYIMPSLVTGYSQFGNDSLFFVSNNTERVAIDRIESKRAIDLREEIERNKIIVESIENAFAELDEKEQKLVELRYFKRMPVWSVLNELGYAEEKSLYRIRRHILDRFLISLNNLLTM